ncbi:Ku protein [Kitasatospora sp. NBC_00374]|uniref:non-homologous end joining protein Ku n=1 Tax=Kitasatospora sp. NBC_00374 TaxID=2975964 RepID=UPI00352F0692
MARPVWTGVLTFGLVTVPVSLYTATDSHTVRFHQLERGTSDRVRNKRVNERTGEEVEFGDIVKGYELASGEYVIVEPDELEQISPGRSRTIDVSGFVDLSEVDPIFFDKTYYLGPKGKEYAKIYGLLTKALEKSNRVGLAMFAMRGKEYLTAVRAENGLLELHTMHFADEVRDPHREIDNLPTGETKYSGQELSTAEQLIDMLAIDWNPDDYHDTFEEQVKKLIEDKAAGREIAVSQGPPADMGLGGIGAAAGPLIGGLITSALSWRAAFVFQALVIAVIIVLSRRIEDPLPPDPTLPFDTVGTVLSAVGLVLVVTGILAADNNIWLMLALLALGALFLAGFFRWVRARERAGNEPLLSTSLFRSRTSNLGLVTQNTQWLLLMGVSFTGRPQLRRDPDRHHLHRRHPGDPRVLPRRRTPRPASPPAHPHPHGIRRHDRRHRRPDPHRRRLTCLDQPGIAQVLITMAVEAPVVPGHVEHDSWAHGDGGRAGSVARRARGGRRPALPSRGPGWRMRCILARNSCWCCSRAR